MYYTYMLRCEDNSIYTGITTDIGRRMSEHFERDKKCARYTRVRAAKKLEAVWRCEDRASASRLEFYIKALLKPKKEELIKSNNLKSLSAEKLDVNLYTRIEL